MIDGWHADLGDCAAADDLPDAARRYVDFVERELEVPVSWVGTGREREQALAR
jgi:adenylosuccinate synthase